MKDKFFKFCEKYIVGGYSIKLKKNLYLGFPKLAPIFTLSFILGTLGQLNESNPLIYTSYVLMIVGVLGFFYFDIFPSRRKDPEPPITQTKQTENEKI